ncbi:MAG TPA: YfiR family protein, partial [Verrucomicrobiae bacterium]|nr:YfiR family protein [Verrucomicrobiae bacterium]
MSLAGSALGQSKEYQIKATFLFNFAQFIDWPTTAFTATNAPFSIGILGDDPFGGYLDEMVRGESID